MSWVPAPERYDLMSYRRCGRSGLKLPAVSLGLWHNFGHDTPFANARATCRRAFDLGITHFDLANNYGPPYGSAEETFGKLLRDDLAPYRHELLISTKAGYDMWPGPYGEWGSRKYLLTSLEHSLKRMGLEYVDIFYSHRVDPETPLEETMGALHSAVQQGKALYAGISSYSPTRTAEAAALLRQMGTPLLIHQPALLDVQPLDRGRAARHPRTGRGRLHRLLAPRPGAAERQVPEGRPRGIAGQSGSSFSADLLTEETLGKVRALHEIARRRGQSLAQMALAWTLRDPRMTSTLVGASSPAQLETNVATLERLDFSPAEIAEIDRYATESGIDLWAESTGA